jgi:hypothetical protein
MIWRDTGVTKRLPAERLMMADRLGNFVARQGGLGALAFAHLKSLARTVWVLACAVSLRLKVLALRWANPSQRHLAQ